MAGSPGPAWSSSPALAGFPTTQIADCGAGLGIVGPGLHRVAGGREVCGPAVTVWTRPGDILFALKGVDLVTAGDVLLIVAATRAVAEREEAWRAAIAGGQSLPAATGMDDLIARLRAEQGPALP